MTPTTEPAYTVDYFIAKFEAIPEEQWCADEYAVGDKCCAYGHCGARKDSDDIPDESYALFNIFSSSRYTVSGINDGLEKRYPQPTPRARILAALRDIKSGGKNL